MTSPLLKPALYQAEGTATTPDAPALRGGRCHACGQVFFPMQRYGCESCGAAELDGTLLSGRGTLLARATVHLHARPDRPTPFVIGTVKLDDGPLVRTLLDAAPDALPPVGAVGHAVLRPAPADPATTADTPPPLDLRFTAMPA